MPSHNEMASWRREMRWHEEKHRKRYYAMVVIIESDDPTEANDLVGAAIDTSDIPDGTVYFVSGTPWEVRPIDSDDDPQFDTVSAIAQRPEDERF